MESIEDGALISVDTPDLIAIDLIASDLLRHALELVYGWPKTIARSCWRPGVARGVKSAVQLPAE